MRLFSEEQIPIHDRNRTGLAGAGVGRGSPEG